MPDGNEMLVDLLAAAGRVGLCSTPPPRWLVMAADRLHHEPSVPIGKIAGEVGVHPVYFARQFRRFFGVSPRSYRRTAKMTSAIGAALFNGQSATEAAYTASFSDQSHMARAVKAGTGVTLSALRTLRSRSSF
jgi:AraC family transcriptional regulator